MPQEKPVLAAFNLMVLKNHVPDSSICGAVTGRENLVQESRAAAYPHNGYTPPSTGQDLFQRVCLRYRKLAADQSALRKGRWPATPGHPGLNDPGSRRPAAGGGGHLGHRSEARLVVRIEEEGLPQQGVEAVLRHGPRVPASPEEWGPQSFQSPGDFPSLAHSPSLLPPCLSLVRNVRPHF